MTGRLLSATEHQLWLAEHLRVQETGMLDATYTTAEVLAVDNRINVAMLEDALRELPQRHAVLRASFSQRDETPYVVTDPGSTVVINRHEVGSEEEFEQLVAESVRRPFVLDEPPLWRVVLATSGSATYLALVLHHIVADGWSVELLVRDLGCVYRALAQSEPLPSVSQHSYSEYAEKHTNRLRTGQLDESTKHWQKVLADAPSTSTVPGLVPSDERGGAQYFQPMPKGRHEDVCQMAACLRATPYAIYLASYALALARMSRSRDVVIGMPSANRREEAVLDVVGPFAAILPIRVQLAGLVTPQSLVGSVLTTLFEAVEHEEVPLARIAAGHRSARAGKPLFQTVAMERGGRDPMTTFAGLPARRLWTSNYTAKYDVVATFPNSTQDERIVIEYDLAYYNEQFAASIAREIVHALDDILSGSEFTVLPDLTDCGETPVHERVAQIARHTPDQPAVVVGRNWLSYGELNHRADLVAAGLRQCGVQRGDRVGLRLPRGIDFVTATLAVVKAGAAYVPTDLAWPETRVRTALAHTVLTIDNVSALLADEPLPPLEVHAGDPLCVLYTSGSTGGLKGVLLAHRSVRRFLAPTQPHVPTPADRVAHLANLAFDASTWEVWGTLLSGATLIVGGPDPLGPREYATVLAECSAALLPTGLFTELVEHPECRAAIGSLRLLMVGGGVLDPGVAATVHRPDALQLNAYGPTESTTAATTGSLADWTPWHSVPIGTPIDGTRTYVLDEELNTVSDGQIGELHLAGAGLAIGYIEDPRQTALQFLPDPFVFGERMYATGDRVRVLPGGGLDFVGRDDAQLKVRGFRVEPAEVESALRALPGVRAAFAGPDAGGRLVAAVRADEGTDPDGLNAALRVNLPDYLVPSRILLTERIPVTPNGKVDFTALLSTQDLPLPIEQPCGRLTDLWSEVLGTTVAEDTEFFAAGGDSLKALRLLAKCRSEFGVNLRPGDLFGHSTPHEFTAILTDRMRRSDG